LAIASARKNSVAVCNTAARTVADGYASKAGLAGHRIELDKAASRRLMQQRVGRCVCAWRFSVWRTVTCKLAHEIDGRKTLIIAFQVPLALTVLKLLLYLKILLL
jgi:hypothetical protein